jgi:hypothetical protein
MNRRPSVFAWTAISATLLLAALMACRPGGRPLAPPVPEKSAPTVEDLASARKAVVAKLRVRGPAPQRCQNDKPPPDVKPVDYTSRECLPLVVGG